MGKRYHCDYCDKTIVAAPSTIKTHNKGTAHQKEVNDHYQQYKDPEQILQEESVKRPCTRFASGQCPFGSICRFSHYTQEDIITLQNYVAQRKTGQSAVPSSFGDLYEKIAKNATKNENLVANQSIIYDSNGVTHTLPWTYNAVFDKYGQNLPPSLKRLKIEDFVDVNISNWG